MSTAREIDADLLDRLRLVFSYDPETGKFTRLRTRGSQLSGSEPGYLTENGYRQIKFGGRSYKAHRLAWLYVFGELAVEALDHINANKLDNRIANLRKATHAENMRNIFAPQSHGTTGFRGVSLKRRSGGTRFSASIRVNGRSIHIGYFDSTEEASTAYLAAKTRLHAVSDQRSK